MLEHAARLGYAAKAVLYAIVGVLAMLAVVHRGGYVTDTTGALRVVLTQPFGRLLTIVLGVGLLGSSVWRIVDAFGDPDRDGTAPSGLMVRVGNAIRGLVYGAVGLEAIRLVRGEASTGDPAELWVARSFEWPFGPVVIGAVGIIIVVYGLFEILKGATGKEDRKVDWLAIRANARPVLRKISRFGVTTRGGLLATVGVFLLRAALVHDPTWPRSTRGTRCRGLRRSLPGRSTWT